MTVQDPYGPPPAPHEATPAPFPPFADDHPPVVRQGRALAGAIAVFLGGYLLILALTGPLTSVAMSVASGGERAPYIEGSTAALVVAQLLFAMLVVIAGLVLARGDTILTVIGALIVAIAPLVFLLFQGARFSGVLPLPRLGPELSMAVFGVLGNPWFHVVLVVGVAWLLTRRAGVGWLTLLLTLALIPVPQLLALANVESGITNLVMLTLSALVGAAIVVGGKPWRERA